jgi:hypothetical protein
MSPGRSDSIQKQQIVGDLKLLELVTISRLSRYATTKNANQACWGRAWIRRRLPAVYKKYGLASDPRITRGTLPGVVLATCTDAICDSRERAQNSPRLPVIRSMPTGAEAVRNVPVSPVVTVNRLAVDAVQRCHLSCRRFRRSMPRPISGSARRRGRGPGARRPAGRSGH